MWRKMHYCSILPPSGLRGCELHCKLVAQHVNCQNIAETSILCELIVVCASVKCIFESTLTAGAVCLIWFEMFCILPLAPDGKGWVKDHWVICEWKDVKAVSAKFQCVRKHQTKPNRNTGIAINEWGKLICAVTHSQNAAEWICLIQKIIKTVDMGLPFLLASRLQIILEGMNVPASLIINGLYGKYFWRWYFSQP